MLTCARAMTFALVVACSLSCENEEPATMQPPNWLDSLAMEEPSDLNEDPHVLEIDLVARTADLEIVAGKSTRAFTYNGTVPGPLIRLTAGDRLIVHFKNELDEPTTVHWHGIRLPVDQDGAPIHSQPPVEPGDSFTYDFVVPDAGLFWYHPHIASAAQVGNGLYGALLVDPVEPDPPEWGEQVVMVLSDMSIQEDGSLAPRDSSGDLASLFGREGEILLINGREQPHIDGRAGLRQRWRIVNASRSRYFQLDLEGTPFLQIGADGGLFSEPIMVDRPVLAPGQRADLLVEPPGGPGNGTPLSWIPYDRGFGSVEFRNPSILLWVENMEIPTGRLPELSTIARAIEPMSLEGATRIEMELTNQTVQGGSLSLGVDGIPFGEAGPIKATVGETQIWRVSNTIQWDHPFHLHGFFFQPLDENDQPIEPIRLLDTINVPVDGAASFAVRFENRPGMWMFHCHILDHADAGMMGMVDLTRP
jgi:FtsP/CotA-like multicopper oxidase with cupredoxin domain